MASMLMQGTVISALTGQAEGGVQCYVIRVLRYTLPYLSNVSVPGAKHVPTRSVLDARIVSDE